MTPTDFWITRCADVLAHADENELATAALVVADMLTDAVGEEAAAAFRSRAGLAQLDDLLLLLGGRVRCSCCKPPLETWACHRCHGDRHMRRDRPGVDRPGMQFDLGLLPKPPSFPAPNDPVTVDDVTDFNFGCVVGEGARRRAVLLGMGSCRVERKAQSFSYEFRAAAPFRVTHFLDSEQECPVTAAFVVAPDGGLLGQFRHAFGTYTRRAGGAWTFTYIIDVPLAVVQQHRYV